MKIDVVLIIINPSENFISRNGASNWGFIEKWGFIAKGFEIEKWVLGKNSCSLEITHFKEYVN